MEQMQLRDEYIACTKGPWITEESTDTQYRISETDDIITITFQGSSSKIDWKQNFMGWKKPYKRMVMLFFVHAGFLKKWKSIDHIVINTAIHARAFNKQIKIRGMSQGAAIALLAHESIWFHTMIHADTLVFGCPRVFSVFGYKQLKHRLKGVVRVQNSGDIVCGLPPWLLLYKHYGKLIKVGKKKLFKLSIKDHQSYKENL